MTVILTFKGMHKPHHIKKTTNSILLIQIKVASNKRVRGLPGSNISDGPREVTVSGFKYLASVDDISGSRGGGWGKFM